MGLEYLCSASGSKEVGGTELLGQVTLSLGVRDRKDLFSAKGLCEDETKVAKTSDTDDADVLGGRASAVVDQGRVDGHTTAQHGGGNGRVERVRDGDGEVGGGPGVVGITTVRLSSVVRVSTVVGTCESIVAVRLQVPLALQDGD